jgi:carbonic anhydrase
LINKIEPAVAAVKEPADKEMRNSSNPDFVNDVAEVNVKMTIENIRTQSQVLKEMEDAGEIQILGGMYDISTGAVHFYE